MTTSPPTKADIPRPVFAYGSLMADHVYNKVMMSSLGSNYKTPNKINHVTLKGFKRFGVTGEPYPAIVPADPSSSVEGVLWIVQSEEEVQLLDIFESDLYRRETVLVSYYSHEHHLKSVEASVYIWNRDASLLTNGDWDYDAFVTNNMRSWIQTQTAADGQLLSDAV
ncbi:hypothetical protein BASA83_003855 [Batrachochytrium salamandrivorans]|nr:hypothetical protein BASA83_003855 [Batrachochytrium salamandrivorans]